MVDSVLKNFSRTVVSDAAVPSGGEPELANKVGHAQVGPTADESRDEAEVQDRPDSVSDLLAFIRRNQGKTQKVSRGVIAIEVQTAGVWVDRTASGGVRIEVAEEGGRNRAAFDLTNEQAAHIAGLLTLAAREG